jgi:hypothetical protein
MAWSESQKNRFETADECRQIQNLFQPRINTDEHRQEALPIEKPVSGSLCLSVFIRG